MTQFETIILLGAVGSCGFRQSSYFKCGLVEVYQYYCNPMTAAGDRRLRPTQWTVLLQYYNSLHRPAQSPHPTLSQHRGEYSHRRFCSRHLSFTVFFSFFEPVFPSIHFCYDLTCHRTEAPLLMFPIFTISMIPDPVTMSAEWRMKVIVGCSRGTSEQLWETITIWSRRIEQLGLVLTWCVPWPGHGKFV